MKILDNVKYDKLYYSKYRKKLKGLLNSEELKKLGIKYNLIGFTKYNYPFETISIGFGEKEIFIVGGTHGSEVIGVDFVLQLIENIKNFEEFNPNLYKIIFIPMQNPEGFDISSSTFKSINDFEYKEKAYEYYKKYRIDSLISIAFESLNKLINNFLNSNKILEAQDLLEQLKLFLNNDKNWIRLSEPRAIPEVKILINSINNIEKVKNFDELKNYLIIISNSMENNVLDSDYLKVFIKEFKRGFENNFIWNEIDKINKEKLHQLMFKDDNFKNLENPQLKNQIIKLYEDNNFPKGSQITYDANGSGINLNANNKLNPGINELKINQVSYGNYSKDNIVRYFKGPIGAPTNDINNFKYELENKYLYDLLNTSFKSGKYLSTFLYHGTGGMIFYKPNKSMIDERKYEDYLIYNKTLASIYSNDTDYKLLDISDTTGYGDLLRRTFPGVLLIELSKMGGNPIGPYGDEDNIYKTINDNFNAIRSILNFYNKRLIKENKNHIL